jgi:hypothetical protein
MECGVREQADCRDWPILKSQVGDRTLTPEGSLSDLSLYLHSEIGGNFGVPLGFESSGVRVRQLNPDTRPVS